MIDYERGQVREIILLTHNIQPNLLQLRPPGFSDRSIGARPLCPMKLPEMLHGRRRSKCGRNGSEQTQQSASAACLLHNLVGAAE
jgi:hypothetical protein